MVTSRHAQARAAVSTPRGQGTLVYAPSDTYQVPQRGRGTRSRGRCTVVISGRRYRFDPKEITLL